MDFLTKVPCLVAAAIMLWHARLIIKSHNPWLLPLVFALFLISIFEFLLNALLSADMARFIVLHLYYGGAVLAATSYAGVALGIRRQLTPRAHLWLALIVALGFFVLGTPGAALRGIQDIGYSVTRVPGSFYWVLQAIIVGCVLTGLLVLVVTMRRSEDWLRRRQALVLLVGSSALAGTVFAVMFMMQIGIKINATVLVSLGTILLILVLVYTAYEHRLFHFLSFVPASSEFKLTQFALRAMIGSEHKNLQGAVHSFEKALISDVLSRCNGNKSAAAKMLGISRTTLRRKLDESDMADDMAASS